MDIFGILTLIGGLALFLYGMDVMGAGLEKVSGGKLERILEKLTSNPLKGVLLGAGVTAVIQSSSATTVMVVGFVNSGIMKLSQAIGIIMGANIGTTVTSWLLSLTGIDSGNVWINLLKPSSFTPVLAMIGIVLMMTGKKSKKADVGEILLGFAVLMTGMESMSGAVKPLADVPEFTNILTMFHNPILGILVGALLTAVIQSSSASVGILQALSVTGAFTYGSVIPIILGQNIGTCVTAMISSVGANRNAKRTAFVHLYFNIIGTVLFLTLYSILNAVIHFPFANDTVGVAGIALIHSIFNIFATVVLFPFTKGLEKLAYLTLPITEEEKSKKEVQEFPLLDDRFLATPSFAIEQCHSMSIEMANLSKDSFLEAIGLLENYTQEVADDIIAKENLVDKYEDKLRAYLTKLSSQNLTYADSQNVSTLLHCITDFERISDHAANIVDSIIEMTKKELVFSKKAEEEMHVFGKAVEDILCRTMTAYTADDEELAKTVEPLEQVIDELNKAIKKRHIKRLRKGKCSIELGLVLADIVTNYERVSDHCSNIAVCLIQEQDKEVEEHDLTAHMDEEDNRKFAEQIKEYTEKYALPEKLKSREENAMALIYIVEDDINIREIERYALKNSGFEVEEFDNGKDFFQRVSEQAPSLMLLDIMLPGEDGLEILGRVRKNPATEKTPVIMVTAKTTEIDKVRGLDMGADDYISKPFGVMELISRVKALLRRTEKEDDGDTLACGSIEIDNKRHSVTVQGETCELTFKEFELLKYLMINQGIVLSRDKLMNQVWGFEYEGESRTVDMHIKTLRHKLGDGGQQIKTVRNVGYVMEP